MEWWRLRAPMMLFVVSTGLLLAGAITMMLGATWWGEAILAGTTLLGLAVSGWWILRSIRDREFTVDVIAFLALAGALWVGEPFAGAVITVMLATGQLLEARAASRARRELSLLAERAPRSAQRLTEDGLEEVPVDEVRVGDRILVRTAEVVPVNGRLGAQAVLDESALTGEPMPVDRPAGDEVRSGVVNAGPPVELRAMATAAESTYAGVVRLVQQAQASSAPFVRAADRVARIFVPVTLLLAGGAWALSGDSVRAVAVLVVATPCPLLLAAPIAIMSGLSRATRVGVVIKGGSALERLAAGRVMLFDKTGTLTRGQPALSDVVTASADVEASELLRLAASLDQVSTHVLASAIVTAATQRGLQLDLPTQVREEHGYGLGGRVGEHEVRLGKAAWILGDVSPAWARQVRRRADLDGSLTVFAAVDGEPAGAFLLEDPLRPDAPRMVRSLKAAGITRIVLVTGDRADTAATVGRIVGVDTVLADQDPADKLAAIAVESRDAATIMVGDGVNDAPALAAAGVGVALAARGATASSEAADVVLTVDRLDPLAEAILIAHRSKRVALQAVSIGMGLSLIAMVIAAWGYLPPTAGALLQEAIDVLAIAIALRAVLPGRAHTATMPAGDIDAARALRAEHDATLALVEQIRAVADALTSHECNLAPVKDLRSRIETDLLPHERADQALLLPMVSRALGSDETTATLSRTHAEIEHQVGRLGRLLDGFESDAVEPEDIIELRRILYGLYAIVRLHNAQEEEGAFSLVPTPT